MIALERGVTAQAFPRNSGHFRLFDLVVVGVVYRSPVEPSHILVPTELPRWRRHNCENLWLQLAPNHASRDAMGRCWAFARKLFQDKFKDLGLMLRHGANGDIHAPSSIWRGSGAYQMHVSRDHAQARD